MFFGGRRRKQEIEKLEAELESLQTSIEEAEVTAQAKDNIINMMLEEKKNQESEKKELQRELRILEASLISQEKQFQRVLKREAKREAKGISRNVTSQGSSRNLLLAKADSRPKAVADSKYGKRGSRTPNLNSATGSRKENVRGLMILGCTAYGLPKGLMSLKLRQNGNTLPGCKSQRMRVKPFQGEETKVSWKTISVSTTEINDQKPLGIEVWKKGTFSSSAVGVVNISLSDLLILHRTKEKAEYRLYKPKERPKDVSQALNGALDRKKQSNSSHEGVMRISLDSVIIQAPSRRASEAAIGEKEDARSTKGVTMKNIIGRWTSMASGEHYYITKKGRVMDVNKAAFGTVTIAVNKTFDVGMVNHDENDKFYFAHLNNGVLTWSDQDKWHGRNKALVILD
mmetsp:Transcript_21833/g.32526  ORF Transcript_21833/g.32526 Transcript_21833/m.32526 type:complete len:400 (+) Transcript_21833:35-1234(+)